MNILFFSWAILSRTILGDDQVPPCFIPSDDLRYCNHLCANVVDNICHDKSTRFTCYPTAEECCTNNSSVGDNWNFEDGWLAQCSKTVPACYVPTDDLRYCQPCPSDLIDDAICNSAGTRYQCESTPQDCCNAHEERIADNWNNDPAWRDYCIQAPDSDETTKPDDISASDSAAESCYVPTDDLLHCQPCPSTVKDGGCRASSTIYHCQPTEELCCGSDKIKDNWDEVPDWVQQCLRAEPVQTTELPTTAPTTSSVVTEAPATTESSTTSSFVTDGPTTTESSTTSSVVTEAPTTTESSTTSSFVTDGPTTAASSTTSSFVTDTSTTTGSSTTSSFVTDGPTTTESSTTSSFVTGVTTGSHPTTAETVVTPGGEACYVPTDDLLHCQPCPSTVKDGGCKASSTIYHCQPTAELCCGADKIRDNWDEVPDWVAKCLSPETAETTEPLTTATTTESATKSSFVTDSPTTTGSSTTSSFVTDSPSTTAFSTTSSFVTDSPTTTQSSTTTSSVTNSATTTESSTTSSFATDSPTTTGSSTTSSFVTGGPTTAESSTTSSFVTDGPTTAASSTTSSFATDTWTTTGSSTTSTFVTDGPTTAESSTTTSFVTYSPTTIESSTRTHPTLPSTDKTGPCYVLAPNGRVCQECAGPIGTGYCKQEGYLHKCELTPRSCCMKNASSVSALWKTEVWLDLCSMVADETTDTAYTTSTTSSSESNTTGNHPAEPCYIPDSNLRTCSNLCRNVKDGICYDTEEQWQCYSTIEDCCSLHEEIGEAWDYAENWEELCVSVSIASTSTTTTTTTTPMKSEGGNCDCSGGCKSNGCCQGGCESMNGAKEGVLFKVLGKPNYLRLTLDNRERKSRNVSKN